MLTLMWAVENYAAVGASAAPEAVSSHSDADSHAVEMAEHAVHACRKWQRQKEG